MKNQLKIAFGIALMSVFSIGCKKDSNKPVVAQKANQDVSGFAVSSDTFKDGIVDHDLLRKNKTTGPHLAWKNTPAGTKGFWIIMDDDKNHVYWKGDIRFDTPTKYISLMENTNSSPGVTIILPEKNEGFAVIETFALSCTPDEFIRIVENRISGERIHHASRARLKEILKEKKLSNMILGLAEVKYKVKPQVVAAADKDPSKPTQTAEPAPGVAKETTPNGGGTNQESAGIEEAVILKIKGEPTSQDAAFEFSNLGTRKDFWFENRKNNASQWIKIGSVLIAFNNVQISALTPAKSYEVRLAYRIGSEVKYSNTVSFETMVDASMQLEDAYKAQFRIATLTLKLETVTSEVATFTTSDLDEFGSVAKNMANTQIQCVEFIKEYPKNQWSNVGCYFMNNVSAKASGLIPSTKYKAKLIYTTVSGEKYSNEVIFQTQAETTTNDEGLDSNE